MKTRNPTVFFLLLALAACNQPAAPDQAQEANPTPSNDQAPDMHTSRNALDWAGQYAGILPCEDCDGIETVLVLNDDETYSRTRNWLGRQEPPQRDEGAFSWSTDGRSITLQTADGPGQQYQVGENVLFHLDADGRRIRGDDAAAWLLEKSINDARIEDTKWLLVELNGTAVDMPETGTPAFLQMDSTQFRVSGNASCNNFFGAYRLTTGGRIHFSDRMGATMMYCEDMSTETAFMDMLPQARTYLVESGTLYLLSDAESIIAEFGIADEP